MDKLDIDWAENVAIRTLAYIGQDEARMKRFLLATGLRGDTIRKASTSGSFLSGVLSAAIEDDSLTSGMVVATGIARRHVSEAHDILFKQSRREVAAHVPASAVRKKALYPRQLG
ncbi:MULTISPECIES: DUF3572 family protein [unclassified Chelatococcus]|uniref:DUF3572 family protein n=1 Tax=unclassified Chelatococcus TaxID=2638111 RepID=UPI001BCC4210|nr:MULTISPECIES: DUF3572 family protein [unclassified Chelatococcus]MBS7699191.1 DUF3572 family protein [Chelatococcus sp. YT9]MBX3554972.1 DUF3572 family protein [Chelatococcus sp.]